MAIKLAAKGSLLTTVGVKLLKILFHVYRNRIPAYNYENGTRTILL
jgi:uncharacterized BrkB/YihY/UPF0761 family membrane protein